MTWSGILSLLKFLPTLIDIGQKIEELVAQGIDIIQIRNAMKSIDRDFVIKAAAERAKRLNDEFRIP